MIESPYWMQVRDLVEGGHSAGQAKRDVQDEIVNLVHRADAAGEAWAAEVLARWSLAGAGSDYTKAFKDLNTVTYIRRDGSRVRKTVAYSRPVRSVESGEIVGRQMQTWWGMSRAAIAELRNDMYSQGEQLAAIVEALDRLIEAMDRHPGCATAREAWEADGHDVAEIDLSAVA